MSDSTTKHNSDQARIAKVERWFAERNFLISFEEAEGFTWVNLVRRETGQELGHYGRGVDQSGAAEQARQPWEQEQAT
jgi:hypothetical protein